MDREDEREYARRRSNLRGYGSDGSTAPGIPGKASNASVLPAGSNGPYSGSTLKDLFAETLADTSLVEHDPIATARQGTQGTASTLPHLDAIQRAFGHHDVSGVRAFVGGAAEHASASLDARAYAFGDDVAFASTPDLHLAAHEAAHVVQQRGGVRLSGNVGQAGDVYEQHANAVADRVVRGESAENLLDTMAHRGSSGGPAVQRDHRSAERARRLRARLERHRAALDHSGPDRPESSVRIEQLQIDHALAELDAAGADPPPALVTRLAREHRDRVRAAAHEDPSHGAIYRVREGLRARAHDESLSDEEREHARQVLRRVHADLSEAELIAIADAEGMHGLVVPESGEDRLPGRTAPTEPHAAGTEAELRGLDGGSIAHHDGRGGSLTASATITQSGGSLEVSRERGGVEASGGIGFSLEHGATGITGGDVTLSAGYGAFSGELTGGGTYYADRPQRQADGSYRVFWRIRVRAGGELSARLGGATVERGGSGELTREGVDIFRDGNADENLAAARRFQESFREWNLDQIADRLERMARMDLASSDWWGTAAVGTERHVEISGAISEGLSGRVMGLLRLGVEAELELTAGAKVKKVDDSHVDVEEEVEAHPNWTPTIGAFGIGITGAGMSGIPTEYTYKVTFTFRVDLTEGATAFADFLAHRRVVLDGTEQGVRLVSEEVERELGEEAGVRLGPLGRIGGGDSTATITTTDYDAEGAATERVTHRASQDFTGNTITGAYSHYGLQVDAPEHGGSYVATADIHTTDGDESRRMLAEETGTRGIEGEATSSGHWMIREEMTQEQMREFHRRFIARPEETVAMATDYGVLYTELRSIPTDESGDARRAEVIAAFLQDEGRRGLQIIQGVGGFEVDQSVRLFGRDGEDPNFLSGTVLHDLETRIEEYRTAIEEHRSDGLITRIQADIALLEAPLAAVSDRSRYTDLPTELRTRITNRYTRLLNDLRGLVSSAETAPAGEGEAATTTESEPTAESATEGAEPERRETRSTDDDSEAPPTPSTTGPRAGVVLAQYLAPHIHRTLHGDMRDLVDETTVDPGPARMPSGLVVELLRARLIQVTDGGVADALGDRQLYNVQLRITRPLRDATSFLVPQLVSGGVQNVEITNHRGQTFEVVVAC